MLDTALRPIKDRALGAPAAALAPHVAPDLVTAMALAATLIAAGLAWQESYAIALPVWIVGRALDGLDGAIARIRAVADDFGGYLDVVADTVGYAAIPLGIALGVDTRSVWIATAFLLAAFYVNTISWAYLAAVLERRGYGAAARGESTSITMPPALIEGTETMAFFALFLLIPSQSAVLFGVMAALVSVNVGQRLWSARGLRR